MSPRSPLPWYRQFWPWFLIALPALSVAFCVACLVLALRSGDSLVRDDWYASGVAINRDIGREREAVRRHLSAAVHREGAELELELQGPDIANEDAELVLDLGHPTQAGRDLSLPLSRVGAGRYRAALPVGLRGKWYAVLVPASGAWRISSRLQLPITATQRLLPVG